MCFRRSSCRRSELHFDINAAGQIELHQGVDRLGRGAVDVDDAAVGAGLEVLAGVLVHVGRAQHAVDLALGGQGDRADRSCSGVVGRFDDFFAGTVAKAKGLIAQMPLSPKLSNTLSATCVNAMTGPSPVSESEEMS